MCLYFLGISGIFWENFLNLIFFFFFWIYLRSLGNFGKLWEMSQNSEYKFPKNRPCDLLLTILQQRWQKRVMTIMHIVYPAKIDFLGILQRASKIKLFLESSELYIRMIRLMDQKTNRHWLLMSRGEEITEIFRDYFVIFEGLFVFFDFWDFPTVFAFLAIDNTNNHSNKLSKNSLSFPLRLILNTSITTFLFFHSIGYKYRRIPSSIIA